LPKPLRRAVVPAADHARDIVAHRGPDDGPLLDVLAAELSRRGGVAVTRDAFDPARLPEHLRLTFAAVDDDRRTIATSDDLALLQRRLAGRVRAAVADATPDLERTGLTGWPGGSLPQQVRTRRGAGVVTGYPALVDEGATVGVRILIAPEDQARAMAAGTRRLLRLTLPSPRKAVDRALPAGTKLALARAQLGSVDELVEDCTSCALDHLVSEHGGPAWDAEAFAALREAVGSQLVAVTTEVVAAAAGIAGAAAEAEARLARAAAPALVTSLDDVRTQVDRLVYPGFVSATGVRRLGDVARYLRAVAWRLDKLPDDPARDRERMRVVHRLEGDLAAATARLPTERQAAADRVRWMIEELRVSLFAQTIGTAYPVSEQRVRRELDTLRAGS
jgi:ATP-dependent helicase HrpA